MKRDTTILAIAAWVLAACALPQAAPAQSFGDMLKDSVKRAAKSEVERQADQATRKVVRCVLGDDACVQAAKKSGAQVETYEPAGTAPAGAAKATPARPGDIKPVPSGPAVPLAQMQASCDADAAGRTAAARKDDAFSPAIPGAAAVLARIKPIFAGFAPNGFETRTGGSMPNAYGLPSYMRSWDFSVRSHPYYCPPNGKLSRDSHYAFSAYIGANFGMGDGPYRLPFDFNPDSSNGDGTQEESRFGFYELWNDWLTDGLPQARNGYFHFPGEYHDTYWFTRGGQLPFAYVSREEFLRKQIDILQTALAHERGEMARLRAAGHPVDETRTSQIHASLYEKPIARYGQLLQQPPAWLQKQAVLGMRTGSDDYSYDFLEASQAAPGVRVPIKPNPAYLDGSRAPGEPQYLVVTMKNQQKRGEYYQLRDLVEQNAETFKSLVN